MVYNSCKQAIIHLGNIPDWLTVKVEINNLRNTDPKNTVNGQTILLITFNWDWDTPQTEANIVIRYNSAAKAHCSANLRLQLRAHAFTELLPGDIQGLQGFHVPKGENLKIWDFSGTLHPNMHFSPRHCQDWTFTSWKLHHLQYLTYMYIIYIYLSLCPLSLHVAEADESHPRFESRFSSLPGSLTS